MEILSCRASAGLLAVGGDMLFHKGSVVHLKQFTLLGQLPVMRTHVPLVAQLDVDPWPRMARSAVELRRETMAIDHQMSRQFGSGRFSKRGVKVGEVDQ